MEKVRQATLILLFLASLAVFGIWSLNLAGEVFPEGFCWLARDLTANLSSRSRILDGHCHPGRCDRHLAEKALGKWAYFGRDGNVHLFSDQFHGLDRPQRPNPVDPYDNYPGNGYYSPSFVYQIKSEVIYNFS